MDSKLELERGSTDAFPTNKQLFCKKKKYREMDSKLELETRVHRRIPHQQAVVEKKVAEISKKSTNQELKWVQGVGCRV